MSYCRFGWGGSDVYVFEHYRGYLTCCGCIMQHMEWVDDPTYPIFQGYLQPVGPPIQTDFHKRSEMIAHLRKHQAKGHTVPEKVFARLQHEIETEGDDVE